MANREIDHKRYAEKLREAIDANFEEQESLRFWIKCSNIQESHFPMLSEEDYYTKLRIIAMAAKQLGIFHKIKNLLSRTHT